MVKGVQCSSFVGGKRGKGGRWWRGRNEGGEWRGDGAGRGVERVKMRCVLEGRVRHGVWGEESRRMLGWCLRMCIV